jgi:phenylalanyl-tRNA synthetase alpha chain
LSPALHPIELRLLSALSAGEELEFGQLARAAGVGEDQARRGLQWLSSKGFVTMKEATSSRLEVVSEPPELRLARTVSAGKVTLKELRRTFESDEEFSAALGKARKAGWIVLGGGDEPSVTAGDTEGPASLSRLLELVASGKSQEAHDEASIRVFGELERRGILTRRETKTVMVTATAKGMDAASAKEERPELERLTPDVISSRSWQGKRLRPIDVEANAPVFFPGRRHPVRDFIREVKEAYISMGFKEVQGESVHTAFWNFDALYIPQDHPGREMQDTFYLQGLSDAKMKREGVVARVASAHEDGWRTGSRGWRYSWRIEEARRLLLRTHNTVLTVKSLVGTGDEDRRVFAVSKVYRNENLDYKHLAEFFQMDGIIVGKGLNVRHLIGFLSEFYKKLGMKDVKLWPTYFPYTEPSLQVMGYSEKVKSWIELSGSGVFRPEVTWPLGVKAPVLAWGPGIERLMLMRYGLDDMRELYGGDLSWLRGRRELASS